VRPRDFPADMAFATLLWRIDRRLLFRVVAHRGRAGLVWRHRFYRIRRPNYREALPTKGKAKQQADSEAFHTLDLMSIISARRHFFAPERTRRDCRRIERELLPATRT
jgi:hypothetical protein